MRTASRNHKELKMSWKTPQIVEMPVGMEINMNASAKHGPIASTGTQRHEQSVIA